MRFIIVAIVANFISTLYQIRGRCAAEYGIMSNIMFVFVVACAFVAVLILLPLSVARLARAPWKWGVLALILSTCTASIAWAVRDFTARCWASDQSMHIRWNVTWLCDQYSQIDKLGDETLRRDYVTNFLGNACILLNLDNKKAPNTYNLVERYYLDWNDRIDGHGRVRPDCHSKLPQ